MKSLSNSVFSLILFNLLVFLLISFIESNRVLNRQKRLDDSPKEEFLTIESEDMNPEEIPCSRTFKREANSLHKLSLCRPPRKRLVALKMPSKYYMPGVYHRPNSYEVERCDGVCPHANHKCLPIEKEIIEVPVTSDFIYGRITGGRIGALNQPSERCMRMKIEKHILCGCQCVMSAQNCNEKQLFSNDRCACECADMSKARTCAENNRMWSNEKCDCVCSPTISRDCSSGAMFDEVNCRCVQTNG